MQVFQVINSGIVLAGCTKMSFGFIGNRREINSKMDMV